MPAKKVLQAVGRSAPYVDVLPTPIIAQRAPTTSDTDYAKGQAWIDESVSPAILYFHIGGGDWNSNELTLSTDATFAGALDTTASSSLAIKTYVDGVAIAGAPVATEAVQGIGELATDAEAVAGTASTALKALLVTPSNFAAVFAAPSAIGGTTPAAGTFTDLTADGTGAVSLTGNAASTLTNTAGDLTVDCQAGSLILDSGEATADAINMDASNAAGGIDIDAGTGGIAIDTTGALSLDSAAASNFTVTGAFDLTLASSAGSVNLTAGESAADSIKIESTAGGIDILASGAAAGEDIDITATGSSVNITSTEGVANAIRLNASAGGIDADAAGQVNIASSQNAADSIVITSSAGGIDILAAAAAAGEDIDIVATGSSVNINSTENAADSIVISSTNGGIDISALGAAAGEDIDITATGSSVNIISTEAVANAIVLDASDAAGGIDVDCGSGGFALDAAAGAISLDSALASNFTVTGAADLTLNSTAGSVNIAGGEAVADAVSIAAAAGGIDLNAALQLSLVSSQAAVDAIVIDASNAAGGIDMDAGTNGIIVDTTGSISLDSAAASNFTVTGAFDLTLSSSAGSVDVVGAKAGADAVYLNASDAAGGVDIDAGTGGVIVDTTGAISLDSAAASNFTVTGAFDLTLASSLGSVNITAGESAADSIKIESTAGGIDILASGAAAGEDIDIVATGSSVNITSTEAAGDAIVIDASDAAGGIDLKAGTGSISSDCGRIIAVTAKSNADTPYPVTGADHYLTGDTSAGVLTFTLPAAPATGQEYYIYDNGGNAAAQNITIDGNGKNIAMSGTVAATKALAAAYSSVHIVYNGTLWLGRYSA